MSGYKPAGHTILTELLRPSPLLHTLLSILHAGVTTYDLQSTSQFWYQLLVTASYRHGYNMASFSAAQQHIERATLLSLELLSLVLEKQDVYLQLLRQTGHPTIVTQLQKLLLDTNPSSGQADHIAAIARYGLPPPSPQSNLVHSLSPPPIYPLPSLVFLTAALALSTGTVRWQ